MRAAAYARYSTDNQTNNSIAYQMEKIQKYCTESNIMLTSFFVDEAETGTNDDRLGFKNMLAAAQRKDFDAVIIYDVTRGSRDVADWFNFRKAMAQLQIQVISCTQNLGDIYNSNDFLVELISVGLGQHQVLETRQKSMDGVAVKAKQGQFLGGIAPLGYDIENGYYVINQIEAVTVRKIFEMYAAGYGYADIIKSLNGAVGKRGRPFGKNSISVILRNERYIGTYTWNKHKVKLFRRWAGGSLNPNVIRLEDSIPQIISKDIWEVVQVRLNNNKCNARNKAKREYLLSGLIECASCGATYIGHVSSKKRNGKTYENIYYVCGDKYRTKICKSKNINAAEIETFVVAHLKEYLKTVDFKSVAQNIAEQVNSKSVDLTSEKKELLNIDIKINNGVKALLAGASIPELTAEIDRLRIRKLELEDIIKAAENNIKTVDPAAIENMFKDAAENIDNAANIRTLINTFITKIYANPDGTVTVNIGVHLGNSGSVQQSKTKDNINSLLSPHPTSKKSMCIITKTFIYKAS